MEDVTDVFLTLLHFDHCGGATERVGEQILPVFPNARYHTNADHWQWATQPNDREKASFLKENLLPMQESGQLNFLPVSEGKSPFPQFDIEFVDGHTDKMMLPRIRYKEHTLVYMADLLPSVGHIPLPYLMAYDTRPLITLEEKREFMQRAAREKYILFFEHDPVNECCTVHETEKGIRLERAFPLSEIL